MVEVMMSMATSFNVLNTLGSTTNPWAEKKKILKLSNISASGSCCSSARFSQTLTFYVRAQVPLTQTVSLDREAKASSLGFGVKQDSWGPGSGCIWLPTMSKSDGDAIDGERGISTESENRFRFQQCQDKALIKLAPHPKMYLFLPQCLFHFVWLQYWAMRDRVLTVVFYHSPSSMSR